jgi:hypothetical protein
MIKKLSARLLPRTLALGFAATVIAAVLEITVVRMGSQALETTARRSKPGWLKAGDTRS